jgi:hypothetical protein
MGPTPRTNHEMFFVMKYFLPLVLFGASGALLASGHPSFSVWASNRLLKNCVEQVIFLPV